MRIKFAGEPAVLRAGGIDLAQLSRLMAFGAWRLARWLLRVHAGERCCCRPVERLCMR